MKLNNYELLLDQLISNGEQDRNVQPCLQFFRTSQLHKMWILKLYLDLMQSAEARTRCLQDS